MDGRELNPWLVRYAYSEGAFPMTMEDGSVEWFQPVTRALFPIEGIHVSRSLGKVLRHVHAPDISTPQPPSSLTRSLRSGRAPAAQRVEWGPESLTVTFDTAFEEVMRGCLRPDENWISEDFIRVYTQIHREGWAHSVEVWFASPIPQHPNTSRPGLAGGLYGLALGSCFCAESMFHRATNASKVALWAMVEKCRSLGFTIFDAQIMNPHLKSLGAYPVPHEKYIAMLREALTHSTPWSCPR